MEEKRYPRFDEDESIGMCSESFVGHASVSSEQANVMTDYDCLLSDDYDPGIGPYTMDELNARIDEAELAIERAENGDESDWVTAEEMDVELYRMFPWLR